MLFILDYTSLVWVWGKPTSFFKLRNSLGDRREQREIQRSSTSNKRADKVGTDTKCTSASAQNLEFIVI